ncbi:MAG: putative homoserine kinase [Planctomycetota bacterium]|nr:putative homoserine kinase [Planctomycetota bacterium]
MKYAIVIPDGASDEPQDSLGGKTPLQAAHTPEMDRVARQGVTGLARNVPDRFIPASDVATLSLFGYDPERYFTGRAPLEAAAMGYALGPDDWAIRCNLMTIDDGRMTDFTAEHITSEEGRPLIEALSRVLTSSYPNLEFHPGVSYRNLMIYRGQRGEVPFADDTVTTPPHDVPDQLARDHMPTGTGSPLLMELMVLGSLTIKNHPVNLARIAAGKRPANAVWLWGQGKAPALPKFADLRGLKGAIISAVDLVRGVGLLAGWDRVDAPGATGYLDTDYASKGRTAIRALIDHDIVCVHVEAPDEASHEGRVRAKVEALERMDRDIVGPLRKALEAQGQWRLLISPDHSTLLRTRAHDRAPVPWAIAGRGFMSEEGFAYDKPAGYDELAAQSGPRFEDGWRLMDYFLFQDDLIRPN